MRHAPSQAADGLHLLRLKQLLFEFRFFFLGLPLLARQVAEQYLQVTGARLGDTAGAEGRADAEQAAGRTGAAS